MELNREQIVKAFECCFVESNCAGCPLHHQYKIDCLKYAGEKALLLIKELTDENEAWQKQLIAIEEKSGKAYYELACEVENLRKENKNLHASYTKLERKCASLNDENEKLHASCTKLAQMLHKADEENTDILVRNFELITEVFLTKPKGE